MEHKLLSLLVFSAIALSICVPGGLSQDQPTQFKGYFTTMPLRGNTVENVLRESAAGTTIPLWSYATTTTVDNNLYTGMIMGGAPNSGTTTIPTVIVPLIVNMPDGGVFNPTVPDPTCASGNVPLTLFQNSPLFQNSGPFLYGSPPVNVGTTQYIDALQRAEFFRLVTLNAQNYAWHTLFGVTVTAAQTLNVPSGDGVTYNAGANGGCGYLGVLWYAWFDNYVINKLIPSLGIQPTSFAVILMYNVVEGSPPLLQNCCILGYHGAYGSPMQVYSPGEFDTNLLFGATSQDITVEAHELGEAMNDPTVGNATPAWGHIGQVSGCQNNFEVGDPLTGTQNPPITLNGYTYHPQELAMFSWFFRSKMMQFPFPVAGDLGVPTWYSTNGSFTTTQGICTAK